MTFTVEMPQEGPGSRVQVLAADCDLGDLVFAADLGFAGGSVE
jgi:hypothetical protein